jgi:hypothetical protein
MFNTLYLQHELRLKHEMICETLFEILIHQKKSIVKYRIQHQGCKTILCKERTDY